MLARPQYDPAGHTIFEEFLVWQELAALTRYALAREDDFTPGEVVASADPTYRAYRRSRVMKEAGPFQDIFAQRLRFYLPHIAESLGQPGFDPTRIEMQITASNDRDYFRVHDDNTRGCPPTREITFVYFFHREPKPFGGGELLLHRGERVGERLPLDQAVAISPEQNHVVFFRSSCLHEILPVSCPSGRFEDSRFTMNGWIHK